jgi:hypothetical protein
MWDWVAFINEGSAMPDMGNVASITLLLGFTREAPRFEHWVKMNGTTIRARTQGCALGQHRERFENFHHRLRRFETPRVHVHNLGWFSDAATTAAGSDLVRETGLVGQGENFSLRRVNQRSLSHARTLENCGKTRFDAGQEVAGKIPAKRKGSQAGRASAE